MKLIYAPSAKRIIPYPPVGLAILSTSVFRRTGVTPEVIDLEIELNSAHYSGSPCSLYASRVTPSKVLRADLAREFVDYQAQLQSLVSLSENDCLGISVMGFEQLASALLLTRMALSKHNRVILGGRFWTHEGARQVLEAVGAQGDVTVTIGDGWEAIADFASGVDDVPRNSVTVRGGIIARGKIAPSMTPPEPEYSWANWGSYESFSARTYRCAASTRRAHLYVWDKRCNFRCAFCRVTSGSQAAIVAPAAAAAALASLSLAGVQQFNFMANELNPSRKYLLRFLSEIEDTVREPISWLTYLRADALERSDLQRVRRAGGKLVRFGVESGSQRMLDLMRKDYTIATVERSLAYSDEAGIWNHVNFMVGFPGESERDIRDTCDFIERNSAAIHSVRINPFYLPPDTAIAKEPEAFGIALTSFKDGWWEFRNLDGSPINPQIVEARIAEILQTCTKLNINFAGSDPFFLLDILSRFEDRASALAYLKKEFPFYWEPAPTDVYKAKLGGYSLEQGWEHTILKRGRNYSLAICTD